ncbi:hypothetical protein FOXG_15744 [Fusarium oxysporum f. sp. lycopersici 4287]|uniref:Uncharacterized protein n=2 Tax=Fusarium oxysporum TaxID=5507 RepID=A0A0J9W5G5_FUSO4|nr:hypothetical protein FOXG_15744 [Fusarium oxysporum f. sp. lycopersici 4287]KNB18108.1 hypothetical protein FOXG_15744 [Fusarium oxysporum f. sp. lycopersici 4287]
MRPSHANIGFWLVWFTALIWSYRNSYDDPSSFFYKSRIAFNRRYSALREKQVDAYLEREIFPVAHKQRTEVQVDNEFLCIGIPSINRTTSGFLAHTVGSLVDTLTPNERNQIHIVVLLADKDPTKHFAYGKDWLFGLADDVLVYSNDSKTESKLNYKVLPHDVRGMGRSDDRVENIRLDHSVLFEACRRRDPTYFALIEDDIIASPDWFTRFKKGVIEVEQKATDAHKDWMYLRLFYSEIFMGWNNEEIFDYLKVVILGYTALIACLLLALRCRQRRHKVVLGKALHYLRLTGTYYQPLDLISAFSALIVALSLIHQPPPTLHTLPHGARNATLRLLCARPSISEPSPTEPAGFPARAAVSVPRGYDHGGLRAG